MKSFTPNAERKGIRTALNVKMHGATQAMLGMMARIINASIIAWISHVCRLW